MTVNQFKPVDFSAFGSRLTGYAYETNHYWNNAKTIDDCKNTIYWIFHDSNIYMELFSCPLFGIFSSNHLASLMKFLLKRKLLK